MDEYQIEKIVAKNGSSTLKINNFLIHSQYNPEKDAENYIKKNYHPHHTHIMLGYGAGYFLDAFRKIRQYNETMIIIDPLFDHQSIEIKKKHQHDFLYNSKSIPMLEFILNEIDDGVRTEYTVICASNYDKLFPTQYRDILQKVRDVQEFNRVNDYTLIRFADDWQKNLKLNLLHLLQDTTLKKLHQYYDSPVVIASSGPSLLKQLPLVKEYRDQLIVISAGSTTKVLLNNDITPDFIVSMDGGIANYNHFKDLRLGESRLIYSFQNHAGIRDSFTKQAFACNVDGYIGVTEYLENLMPQKIPTIIGGATVANFAFSIAQYITSGPIAFIGQDLAFTNNQTHVSGHSFSGKVSIDHKNDEEYLYTDGYNGDKVLTNPSLYSMKLNFEKIILLAPSKNQFFNCTEGGVLLKGYEQLPFKEFCHRFAQSTIKVQLQQYDSLLTLDVLKEQFQKEKEQLMQAVQLYQLAMETIEKNKSDVYFDTKTLKKLEEIDEQVKPIIDETAIGTILTPTLMKVSKCYQEQENETQRQKFKRVKAQNLALYEESQKACEKVLQFLDEAMDQLQNEKSGF